MARQEKTKLQIIIDKALQGNQSALEYLHVSDMRSTWKWSKATVMTWEKLCSDNKYNGAAYNPALEMKMDYLTRVTKMNLIYLTYIAKTVFKREFDQDMVTIGVEEILEHMKLQAGEVPPARLSTYYDQLTDEEDDEDEEEGVEEEREKANQSGKAKQDLGSHASSKGTKAKKKHYTQRKRSFLKNGICHKGDLC